MENKGLQINEAAQIKTLIQDEVNSKNTAISDKLNKLTGSPKKRKNKDLFHVGETVIYGLLGKFEISAIETKKIGESQLKFYKLDRVKQHGVKLGKASPSIWLPVENAQERGLRTPSETSCADEALKILESREYYFPISENWGRVQISIENAIQKEAIIGLAKTASYFAALKKKGGTISPAATKFSETITNLLVRELSDVLQTTHKVTLEKIQKLLKNKNIINQ